MDFPVKTRRTVKWLLSLTDDDIKGFTGEQKRTLRKDCQGLIESWGNVIANSVHTGDIIQVMTRERNQLIELTKKLK